jgi:arylsulfatase A-like enzyme
LLTRAVQYRDREGAVGILNTHLKRAVGKEMIRHHRFSLFIRLMLVVVLLPAATQQQTAAMRSKTDQAKLPNIVFVMSDDHAAHAISAYGSRLIKTPNIDRLAKDGMLFENCFVTNSICTPSRAAILTGKYSHLNGVPVFNHIDKSQPMLQKYLQSAGYYTAIVGKWHLGGNRNSEGEPTGFDYWNILPGQGAYFDPLFIENGQRKKYTGYTTDIITDLAIESLKNRPPGKPLFLMYHHKAPHRNWQPDEKHRKQFENVNVPEPITFNDDYATRSDAARLATMRIDRDLNDNDLKMKPPEGLSGQELKGWKYQRYMRDYLACVASVDDNMGRLIDWLGQNGLTENTIVIYTSDQGFFLGEHNFYDKRFMYEESLRMPFLIRWPGRIKAGSVNNRMILNVDFAPTLLAAAGQPVPSDMQGRSFLPLLEGKNPKEWRTSMYYRYYHPGHHNVAAHYGVRTEGHKLIYFNKLDQWELFDLKRDPQELKNVYQDPAYAEVVKRLKTELYRLKKELKDTDQFADNLPQDDVG